MEKQEIRRRALYAAAHITFVATAAACRTTPPSRASHPGAEPPTYAPVAVAPGAPMAAHTSCERPAAQLPAPTPTPPVTTTPVTPTATTPPRPTATTPVVTTPDEASSQACIAAARAVQSGSPPPEVQACCSAVIHAAEIAWKSGQPRSWDHYPCCDDHWDSFVCQAWGPPAPARSRRVSAEERRRALSRWS